MCLASYWKQEGISVNRCQAITWTNGHKDPWYYIASLGLNGLTFFNLICFDTVSICKYRQISNINHTSVDNKIIDHSDVVGTSPAGAAPTTSSFST